MEAGLTVKGVIMIGAVEDITATVEVMSSRIVLRQQP
jgi:hypothetical protein